MLASTSSSSSNTARAVDSSDETVPLNNQEQEEETNTDKDDETSLDHHGHHDNNSDNDDENDFSSNINKNDCLSSSSSSSAVVVSSEVPRSLPLGEPLPTDSHACSVSLPTWAAVVGYEEGSPAVVRALKCGYPRFVYHPYVLQLMNYVVQQAQRSHNSSSRRHHDNDDDDNTTTTTQVTEPQPLELDCLVLPSKEAALRCQVFLQQALYHDGVATTSSDSTIVDICHVHAPNNEKDGPTITTVDNIHTAFTTNNNRSTTASIRLVDLQTSSGVHAVLFPAQTLAGMEAKAYWQHTGEVVSSRRAQACLEELGMSVDDVSSDMAQYEHDKNNVDNNENGNDVRSDKDNDDSSKSQQSLSAFASTTRDDASPHSLVKDRIAHLTQVPSDHVYLTASGMASIYTALLSSRRCISEGTNSDDDIDNKAASVVVFGFPYLDTLKLCSRTEFCRGGVEFFGHGGEDDLNALEAFLQTRSSSTAGSGSSARPVCALFTELPSNPLLQCPNLERLRTLTDEYGVCLVVDDTIGNFYNVDLLQTGLADVVCTSLTKFFSGRGDAMAGSLIANPYTTLGRKIQADLVQNESSSSSSTLFDADAWAIWHNSHSFPQRMARINETTSQLADYLMDHADVEQIYYPKYHSSPYYANYVRGNKDEDGDKSSSYYGGLFSILLDSHICQRTFYDALDVAKGPSLGTNFTLACPYTLLAHYHELDFAMSYNVQPNLLRISVGLEDFDELRDKFASALAVSRLHPKISPTFRHRGDGGSGSSIIGGANGHGSGGAGASSLVRHYSTGAAGTRTASRGFVRSMMLRAAFKFALRNRGCGIVNY